MNPFQAVIVMLALWARISGTISLHGSLCTTVRDGDCAARVVTAPVTRSAQVTWAYIVTGESSGQWPEGSALVAWTLRAWQVHKGMPADKAGRRWGWNGWRSPTQEAVQAVRSVWNQPPTQAPFDFMRAGRYCRTLINERDRLYLGLGPPDFILTDPGTDFQMECYFN